MSTSTTNRIKQLLAFRQTDISRMAELKDIADRALLDNQLHNQFKIRYKHIDLIYDDFQKQHTGILGIYATLENSDLDVENEIRILFENNYYHIQAVYVNMFEESFQTNDESKSQPTSHIKLPKIELLKFDGDIKKWPTFIDMFKSIVHENAQLSNIEKFNYLISSLSNAPLMLVKCTPLTDTNYLVAFNSLINRYDNKRLLATAYWREIKNSQKIMDAKNNSTALRQLLDTFTENISALKTLSFPVEQWDFILFNMLFDRLDIETATRFELAHNSTEMLPYNVLLEFLNKQCNALDTISSGNLKKTRNSDFSKNKYAVASQDSPFKTKQSSSFLVNANTNTRCTNCNGEHFIYKCPSFLSKTPHERFNIVKQNKWCINCLGSKHTLSNCNSEQSCKICKSRHHSLLHFDRQSPKPTVPIDTSAAAPLPHSAASSQVNTLTNVISSNCSVLLSTALIEVLDSCGNFQTVRALLDSGSQANFITDTCVRRLGLNRSNLSFSINGLGLMNCSAASGVTCTIRPCAVVDPSYTLDFVTLPKICANMPTVSFAVDKWDHIVNLKLADPNFNTPGSIDMLLGADIFPSLLRDGRIVGNSHKPTAINTVLGWILMGQFSSQSSTLINTFITFVDSSIDSIVKRFWEIEEIPSQNFVSPDDARCEQIFSSTHSQNSSGRFIVKLPFRDGIPSFSDSRSVALRRFLFLERRLISDSSLYQQYSEFMKDYLDSGHMEPINLLSSSHQYYIPHHCIIKPESSTTKLRVVFDASAKTSDNISLNDTLLIGPKLQQDITTILLKFRSHSIVFTADIKQMYRQILLHDSHRNFQRILWRFSPNDPVQDFRLNTVTYGVSSAPFLAIRTLLQLAENEKDNFPDAACVLSSDTYVDDLVTGCDDLENAVSLQANLISLLKKGNFELRKWASNHPSLLSNISVEDRLPVSPSFDRNNEVIKILGLKWNPSDDSFSYEVTPIEKPCTKRTILSELARIFDPLGFLAPLSFFAKHLIQQLWTLGLDWDESPPSSISSRWLQYKSELSQLSHITIPRYVLTLNYLSCELHGFSDSSEKGYAAVIYFRFLLPNNNFEVHLVCAKSKVAPLKRISLPRLELCGAVLLADLIVFVLNTFSQKLSIDNVFAWTDSMTVLSWIKSSPHRWKTFVSNRVSHIQNNVSPNLWRHVRSKSNPADCASRGLLPSELIAHSLWWAGPSWLYTPQATWAQLAPITVDISTVNCEDERKLTFLNVLPIENLDKLLEKYSSLPKIKRIIAYCVRFIHNCKYSTDKKCNTFTDQELHTALLILIKRVQYTCFEQEIENIQVGKSLCKSLRKLSPFLDEKGFLRVGGRLSYSRLSFDQKHPILLPRNHRLTDLIIEQVHKENHHPGLQTLHYLLLQQFWILSPKRAIHKVLSRCFKCWKTNPSSPEPLMGNLPSLRVSQIKPFSCVGVDYGGPFSITLGKTRGAKTQKAYICLFVCFSTKALHLELVSDLSTEAFLASLRRFIARRGRCSYIYSDCGTNFVGAAGQISHLMQQAAQQEMLNWHFNPPSAPHFGGLWEAGIKSVKSHINRVVGEQILTYEEFYTLLIQIEALLNSRPLCPLSSDPNDLMVLTPGHFLTLEPLTCLPDPDLSHIKLNRLTRWQLLQRLHQDFWTRWHHEYLHTLHQRSKWTNPSTPISPGMMVLIKNNLAPPLRWQLGRIENVHPGADGIVRVATVKTTQGSFKRPIVKLCPLPMCS